MDASDRMGVQRDAGRSPAGFLPATHAPKNWANPLQCILYMEMHQIPDIWSFVTAALGGESSDWVEELV